MKMNIKGFTLAELLIVVAIISVLVGISIPVFSSQLEKSREATDLANVRSAYAEMMTAVISEDKDAMYEGKKIYRNDGTYCVTVELKQQEKDWQGSVSELGGVKKDDSDHWIGVPSPDGKCTITYSENDGVILNWNGFSYQTSTAWTHAGGSNGVGQTLYQETGTNWSKHVTAVNETIDANVNNKITIKADSSLSQYRLGFYAVDPITNKVIYDSGSIDVGSGATRTITNALSGSTYDGNVKIVVQLINKDNNTPVGEDVADKIMKLISISE